MKLLIINGPNLNLLGVREPDIYGKNSYDDLCRMIDTYCNEKNIICEIYQSNHEGDIVDKIQSTIHFFDGIVINPAAYTHTSVAIADALKAVALPYVEVHISDVSQREPFRQISYIRKAAKATITGLGFDGYIKAIDILSAESGDVT